MASRTVSLREIEHISDEDADRMIEAIEEK